jgi:hypothetical protein
MTDVNYGAFEADGWDQAGATADMIKASITETINTAFSGIAISSADKQAISDAAFERHQSQQSMRAAAAAAQLAAGYDRGSPLYNNAMASVSANESLAKHYENRAIQIMNTANRNSVLVGRAASIFSLLGPAINATQLTTAAYSGDAYLMGQTAASVLAGMAIGSLVMSGVGALGVPVMGAAAIGIAAGFAASTSWKWFWQNGAADFLGIRPADPFRTFTLSEISSLLVNTFFLIANQRQNLRDPLALDLDNNGITTLPSTDGIMFDHNGSGTKYGTGWINPADGWLALDRNNNNKIDSGRELFGDNTIKLDGNKASDAYDALASFNTNNAGNSANKIDLADATGDTDNDGVMEAGETYWDMNRNGVFDAGVDKTFADLRVWVDANKNAVTDSGELKTLAELNIVSIGTGKTAVSITDNGNLNTFKGNYTKNTGEVVDGARAFNLAENKAFREFADTITPDNDVLNLPNMQGMGAVRDLHEAMSLPTDASSELTTTVQAFSNATTRAAIYRSLSAPRSGVYRRECGGWLGAIGFDTMLRITQPSTVHRISSTSAVQYAGSALQMKLAA